MIMSKAPEPNRERLLQKPGNIAVFGATSSLAQALCHRLAARGHGLVLAGRDEQELELLAGDLSVRYGISPRIILMDMMDASFNAEALLDDIGVIDSVVIALGDLPGDAMFSRDGIAYAAHVNYTAPAQIAAAACEHLAKEKYGTVVIISSVAGDRGRRSNYPYGAAKAALSAFASGLRNRYAGEGVHVMTVKPGFIDTPMTWGMKSPLIAGREYVADTIAGAMEKRKDVLYVPFFWRFIMLIICAIPERVFKRLKL